MTNLILKHKFYFFLCLICPLISSGQKWVADSIIVSFGRHDTLTGTFNVLNATDWRAEEPECISVFEQKKGVFFPVDQIVKTKIALSNEFTRKFSSDSLVNQNYRVDIHEFFVKNSTTTGKRDLTLFSILELSKYGEADSTFLGTFYYEQSFIQKKKIPVEKGYETLLEEWGKNFVSDVIAVDQGLDTVLIDNFYHFRRRKHAVKKNLYIGLDFFAGLNFWGVDGEMWFSEPEGSRIFTRNIGIIRYVNHPDFQAIAFGKNVRLWNYRFSEKWLFTHKLALLVGFNNWKDMDTADHKLEEIPYFNCSFSQQINYNLFDQSGLVFGIGIMEDAHYIIYHNPKLKVGLSLNCAYKF